MPNYGVAGISLLATGRAAATLTLASAADACIPSPGLLRRYYAIQISMDAPASAGCCVQARLLGEGVCALLARPAHCYPAFVPARRKFHCRSSRWVGSAMHARTALTPTHHHTPLPSRSPITGQAPSYVHHRISDVCSCGAVDDADGSAAYSASSASSASSSDREGLQVAQLDAERCTYRSRTWRIGFADQHVRLAPRAASTHLNAARHALLATLAASPPGNVVGAPSRTLIYHIVA